VRDEDGNGKDSGKNGTELVATKQYSGLVALFHSRSWWPSLSLCDLQSIAWRLS